MAKKKAARGGTRLRSNVQMRDIRKLVELEGMKVEKLYLEVVCSVSFDGQAGVLRLPYVQTKYAHFDVATSAVRRLAVELAHEAALIEDQERERIKEEKLQLIDAAFNFYLDRREAFPIHSYALDRVNDVVLEDIVQVVDKGEMSGIEDIVSEAKVQSSERVEAIVAEAKEEGRLAGEK